jgi:Protein of unknown function (DUF998)
VSFVDGTRRAALGGIIGPVSFIGGWFGGAIVTSIPYSSVDDAISRLAAIGADTRPLMTAGFVVFGVSLPVYATALRACVGGRAWIAAATTGVATLAVAAAPLDHSPGVDRLHGVFAGIGYVALAATPLLAARPLRTAGHRRLAAFGVAAGVTSAVSLAITTTALPTGLFQRLGLTVSDAWIIGSAALMATGSLRRSTHDVSTGVVSQRPPR